MAITVYACRELYLLLILNLIQMKKFLLLSLFLSALYVRAAVVPVSGTETIADAVSSAVAGDIIELSEAVTYVGNVTIDKSLTLRAAEGLESAPIIQGKLSIKDGATIRGIVFLMEPPKLLMQFESMIRSRSSGGYIRLYGT